MDQAVVLLLVPITGGALGVYGGGGRVPRGGGRNQPRLTWHVWACLYASLGGCVHLVVQVPDHHPGVRLPAGEGRRRLV